MHSSLALAFLIAAASFTHDEYSDRQVVVPTSCFQMAAGEEADFVIQASRLVSAPAAATLRSNVAISAWEIDSVRVVSDSLTCAQLRQKVLDAAAALGKIPAFWPDFSVAKIGPETDLVDSRIRDGARWYFVARSNSATVHFLGLQR